MPVWLYAKNPIMYTSISVRMGWGLNPDILGRNCSTFVNALQLQARMFCIRFDIDKTPQRQVLACLFWNVKVVGGLHCCAAQVCLAMLARQYISEY